MYDTLSINNLLQSATFDKSKAEEEGREFNFPGMYALIKNHVQFFQIFFKLTCVECSNEVSEEN